MVDDSCVASRRGMSQDRFSVIAEEMDATAYKGAVHALTQRIRQRQVLPFLGAGISVDPPACLPPAGRLVPPLLHVFRQAIRAASKVTRASTRAVAKAEEIVGAARMERLLDVLHQTHGASALAYLECLRGRAWNGNHASLAAMAAAHLIRTCVTLNFDLLLEYAVAARGEGSITECPLTGHVFREGDLGKPPCMRIIKPHGSFSTAAARGDAYEALSATLSQVGTRPSFKNRRRLEAEVESFSTLLVAGYSDDDWDVFPLLQELGTRFEQIVWIKHVAEDDVAHEVAGALLRSRAIESADIVGHLRHTDWDGANDSDVASLTRRVIPWLKSSGLRCTLLLTRARDVLAAACKELGLTSKATHATPDPAALDVSGFWPSGHAMAIAHVRTMVALAALLRSSGPLASDLLAWLSRNRLVRADPELLWQVERHLAHTEHTDGYLLSAVRHMRRVVRIKRENRIVRTLPEDLVWLGYEYLCLAKRPFRRKSTSPYEGRAAKRGSPSVATLKKWLDYPCWILLVPTYVVAGIIVMQQGVSLCHPGHRAALRSKATYYKADLLHNWGSYAFLLGASRVRLARWYFKWLVRLYDRIASMSEEGEELLSHDYYWMRRLEARLVANAGASGSDRALIEDMLLTIEHRNRLVQDYVQVGNTYAYRALLAFFSCEDGREQAGEMLNEAEQRWAAAGGTMASGRRRVALFRRFIGELSLRNAVRALLGPRPA